jgi:hypothetical protein
MATQSINLGTTTAVTFNGTTVNKINLNGSQIWAKAPQWILRQRIPSVARTSNANTVSTPIANTDTSAVSTVYTYIDITGGPLVEMPRLRGSVFHYYQIDGVGDIQIGRTSALLPALLAGDSQLELVNMSITGDVPHEVRVKGPRSQTLSETDNFDKTATIPGSSMWRAETNSVFVTGVKIYYNTNNKPSTNSAQRMITAGSLYNANYIFDVPRIMNLHWDIVYSVSIATANTNRANTNATQVANQNVISIGTINGDSTISKNVGYSLKENYAAAYTDSYGNPVVEKWTTTFAGWLFDDTYCISSYCYWTGSNIAGRPKTLAALQARYNAGTLPTGFYAYRVDFDKPIPTETTIYHAGSPTPTETVQDLRIFDKTTGEFIAGFHKE